MTAVEITGRILFLSADPLVMDAQLAGADLELVQAGALRDDISTDEITPVAACIHFDERLASYPIQASRPASAGLEACMG